jgi:hypothetical protein
MGDTVAQLKGLKELLDGGVLTQEEFDAQKTVILDAQKSKITQVAPAPVVGQQPVWAGLPPPNESASSWWGMYLAREGYSKVGPDGRFTQGSEPGDCGNCAYAFFCGPCAHGEVTEWASDGRVSSCVGLLQFLFCGPCEVQSARMMSEDKIWQLHSQRGDPKAQMMGPNKQAHAGVCPCICGVMLIPFVNFFWPLVLASANAQNYGVMKTCQARQHDGALPARVAHEFTGDMSNACPVCGDPGRMSPGCPGCKTTED